MQVVTRRKGLLFVALVAICALFALGMATMQGSAASKIKCKSVSLNASAITLAQGDMATLQAKLNPTNATCSLSWKSSDKKVATVTKTGTVTAIADGTATITVKTSNKKTASCVVTVKEYLTQEEALALIKSNVLSEEGVVELIKENTLSEGDIKQLVKDNTLSEDVIKQLVKDNTLTEAQIRAIASQYAGQSGVSESQVEAIVKRLTGQNWADGTKLTFYNEEDLEGMLFKCYEDDWCQTPDLTAKVKSATITKKRTSEKYEGKKQLYEYDIHIEGTYEGSEDDLKHCDICIDFMRSDGSARKTQNWFRLKNVDDFQTITASNGEFVLDSKAYDIYTNYDMFIIYPAVA